MSPSIGQPSKLERELLTAIDGNSLDRVVELLAATPTININAIDENGMSLLQHACYHGNVSIARYLLERGADVNQNNHESGYTALMFAALGGHLAVLSLLLDHGANVTATNSVNRNASQMAAFVGQHRSVAVINNFIPRSFIDHYSHITGLEKEPRLPARLIQPVASFVRIVNIHPVRVALFLKQNASIFLEDEFARISKVLDLMVERLFKQSEPLEMFSLKVHYLNFLYRQVVAHIEDAKKKQKAGKPFDLEKALCSLFRKWYCLEKNSISETCELLLRESIRSYEYQANTLFQQLVQTLSTIKIGDEPSCLAVLSQAILGKSIDGDETNVCFACHQIEPDRRCSECRVAYYCNQLCQRIHWPIHKQNCAKLRQIETQRMESEAKPDSGEENNENRVEIGDKHIEPDDNSFTIDDKRSTEANGLESNNPADFIGN